MLPRLPSRKENTSPHVFSPPPSTPSASRSRRLRNEAVIGPNKNGFLGSAAALDEPAQYNACYDERYDNKTSAYDKKM